MTLTTWQSPHPDDLGEWLVGYQGTDVNAIIARCEAEDDARRIVRDGNAHDALVAALQETIAIIESRWGVDPTCLNASAWREARLAEWRAALALAEENEAADNGRRQA